MVRRRLNVDGEIVTVEVDRVINAGFSGRDRESVQAHIDELLEEDVLAEAPEEVPTAYRVAPYRPRPVWPEGWTWCRRGRRWRPSGSPVTQRSP